MISQIRVSVASARLTSITQAELIDDATNGVELTQNDDGELGDNFFPVCAMDLCYILSRDS